MTSTRKDGAGDIINDLRAAAEAERATLPTFEQLCLQHPLYSRIEVRHRDYLTELRSRNFQFDAYCVYCGAPSIFKTIRSHGSGLGGDPNWMLEPGDFDVNLKCQRGGHSYLFSFRYVKFHLIKFGQIPSIEDIAGADIRKYAPLLRDGYFQELERATGLASHGIGIGSFVYLRRIFERLIRDHHQALIDQGQAIDGFDRMRMEDRIHSLREVLPAALVKNRAAYGILSVGIHELDEDTCRRYFPVVRAAIIQILEQDLQAREREKAAADLERAIADIADDLKNPPPAKGPG